MRSNRIAHQSAFSLMTCTSVSVNFHGEQKSVLDWEFGYEGQVVRLQLTVTRCHLNFGIVRSQKNSVDTVSAIGTGSAVTDRWRSSRTACRRSRGCRANGDDRRGRRR
jgi:hypothetical protein